MKDAELAALAMEIRERAYAPYSKFRVGAALLTSTGKVYTGVNVENASFGATNCAERTAVFKAVTDGELEISAIAIAGDSVDYLFPCGICRQVLAEFGKKGMKIICCNKNGDFRTYTLEEVLPFAFTEIK
ncbi:MAG: cytidine deaminase [Clostridiales bacterium]|nr:cytidine deaminase [Clostridiales bacterium]